MIHIKIVLSLKITFKGKTMLTLLETHLRNDHIADLK